MSFLVLLLVLVVEKLSSWRARLQRDSLWLGWLDTVGGVPSLVAKPWLGLLTALLPPLLLLALLLTLLEPVAYGLLALPVHLLVAVWSLGRGDILRATGPFRDAWRREDAQGAYHVAERDLGVQADNDDELLAQVQGTLVWQAYQAFFAVIFWYALLGPVAALTYRLLAIAAEQGRQPELRERAVQLRHAFDWLPARALVLSFALVGNFVAVSRSLLHDLLAWDVPAARLLAQAGYVAEDFNEGGLGAKGVASLDALWQLLVRSAVLWYAAFAVWTLLL
ncbi:regulatory signaling modulator protein AmpE [Pseudomonas sp. SCB32]|uniref:regulatory signaling modulator protein AmpE n=1 Tax=Pseudomonas sp. SCB32 TaxID=2653853 RepID=UPI00126539D2|nr:regulatory signaling modulator protein AmpE [Pseudomonas sp. SCB32]